jgi:pilus assembly protein CpaC
MKQYRPISTLIVSVLCLVSIPFVSTPALATGAQGPAVSGRDSINELSLVVGKSVVMDFDQRVQRVSVGLNDVIEATAISPTEVLLNGKVAGQTSLIVWQSDGNRQFFDITVRAATSDVQTRVEAVRRQLRLEFPGDQITVTSDNGSIFLRGQVHDLASSDRAVEIASTALASGAAPGTNLLAKALSGGPPVATPQAKVVNLLYVDVPAAQKQILLKVRFASVDRTRAQDMGINLFSLGLGNTIGGISTQQFPPPSISGGSSSPGGGNGVGSSGATATFSDELNFLAYFPGLKGGADIKALEQMGVVEVLAEPNVIAADGKQASFLAGGEYPYPVAQGGAAGTAPTITLMFKEFGVRLNFIPTITPRGTIRLQVAPEVSSLDFTNGVQVSGFKVPAISSRKVMTEVELSQGQTFVIGGLLDNRETETLEKIPFIGDIPVLGKFFQSMSRSKTNTELIVAVTPELVNAIPAGAPLPELKFPVPFLPPNSPIPMHQPDIRPANASAAPPPTTIPVEQLIESQQPEKPLITDQGFLPTSSMGSSTGTTPP